MAPVAPPPPPPLPAPAKRLFLLATLLPSALAAVALPHSPTWPSALVVGSLASLPLLLCVARLAPPLFTYAPHPALEGATAFAAAPPASTGSPPALGGYVKMPVAMAVFAVGVAVVDTLPLVVVASFLGFMSVWGVYALGVWGGLYAAARSGGEAAPTAVAAAVTVGGGDAEAPPASPGAAATAEAAAAGAGHGWQVVAEAFLVAATGAGVAGVLRTVGGVTSGGVRIAAGAVAAGAAAAAGRWRVSFPVGPPDTVGDGGSTGGAIGSAAVAPSRVILFSATVGLAAAAAGTVMTATGSPWVDMTAVPLAWGAAVGAAWVAALLDHVRTVAPYWDPADWGSLARPGGVLSAALASLATPAVVQLGAEGGVAAAAAGASRLAAARAAGAVAAAVERPVTADWQRAARSRCVRLVVVAVVETVIASGEVAGWWGRRRLGLVSAIFLLGAVGLSDAGTGIAWVFS
ncbi:hypothetical protein MMPV_006026 [Pyropia vietnamensis]